MPRVARASVGGICYHVINRGNDRRDVFLKDGDYQAFLKAMGHACIEIPMPVLAYCLMPNHFHMVLLPKADGDLSRWMHWVQNTHVRRYHQDYHRSGRIWQGRFKAFPIESDEHLLTVLRYAECNPVRANLVQRAEEWLWSSARFWTAAGKASADRPSFLESGPVKRPRDWLSWVNRAATAGELESVRRSVLRGVPFGSPNWTARMAAELGLESTLRPPGRPRKKVDSEQDEE